MKLLLRFSLYEKYTIEELTLLSKSEINQKRADEIAQAITLHLIDKKKKDGTYEKANGYSGRQTKRTC